MLADATGWVQPAPHYLHNPMGMVQALQAPMGLVWQETSTVVRELLHSPTLITCWKWWTTSWLRTCSAHLGGIIPMWVWGYFSETCKVPVCRGRSQVCRIFGIPLRYYSCSWTNWSSFHILFHYCCQSSIPGTHSQRTDPKYCRQLPFVAGQSQVWHVRVL